MRLFLRERERKGEGKRTEKRETERERGERKREIWNMWERKEVDSKAGRLERRDEEKSGERSGEK